MSKTTGSSVCRRLHGIMTTPPPTNNSATATKAKSSGCSSSKRQDKIEKMVRKFKKCSTTSTTFRSRHDIYTKTVHRLAKHKRFSMIIDILDHQKNFHEITDESFTSRIISLYGKVGMFENARKLFDDMPELNCPRTVYSFNALLSACVYSEMFHEVEELLNELPEKLGIALDSVSYNIVIKGLCKMGALNSAELVLDEMVAKDVKPSLITFNTLLFGFFKNGKVVDGGRIWDRMVEMDVVPNVTSYDAKLLGLTLEKRIEDAVKLVEEMRGKGIEPDLFSFNALIKGFVNDDNLEEAKRWYGEIGKNDCVPNNMTIHTIVPFLCEKGDVGFAFQVCEGFLSRKYEDRVHPKVLQLVLDGLVKQSKIEEAEKLVQFGKRNKYTLKLASNV